MLLAGSRVSVGRALQAAAAINLKMKTPRGRACGMMLPTEEQVYGLLIRCVCLLI